MSTKWIWQKRNDVSYSVFELVSELLFSSVFIHNNSRYVSRNAVKVHIFAKTFSLHVWVSKNYHNLKFNMFLWNFRISKIHGYMSFLFQCRISIQEKYKSYSKISTKCLWKFDTSHSQMLDSFFNFKKKINVFWFYQKFYFSSWIIFSNRGHKKLLTFLSELLCFFLTPYAHMCNYAGSSYYF